jgi:hypothetical protein
VAASRAWYDDLFALHGIPVVCDERLWVALADPPPYHSRAKTLEPGVPAASVLAAVGDGGTVADSFADQHLPGFALLLEATWVHHAGGHAARVPAGWSVVTAPEVLARWCEHHDYIGVLPAAVLDRPGLTVLGWFESGELVGGAVLHDGSQSVGLSNTWNLPGRSLDPDVLLAVAHGLHPDRELTGYAGGAELRSLLDVGFTAVGTQRVWTPMH